MAGKEATPLSVLLGKGEEITVGERSYRVLPLKLKDVPEFTADSLSIGSQLFNVVNQEARTKLDKWISKQVVDASGAPMTLQRAIDEDWDLDDLKGCLQRLVGISG